MSSPGRPRTYGTSQQSSSSRRKQSEEAEIGTLSAVKNPRNRKHGECDPGFFAFHYFPSGIGQGVISQMHFEIIDTIDECLRNGGYYAQAICRGFLKTTIAEVMVLRALLYGHRKFLGWIGAEDSIASESVDAICMQLEENEALMDDFPEVCLAFRALDGKHQRCKSQTFDGLHTHIHATTGKVVLPTIKLEQQQALDLKIPVDSRGYTLNSSSRLEAFGILSFKRGRKHARGDGGIQRIDGVVIDDFQTDLSAQQPSDINRRLQIIRKSILRSGSHRESLACVVNGTVINAGDGMDQILDRQVFPKFKSKKIPMMKALCSEAAEKLWHGPYAEKLSAWSADDEGSNELARASATEFYAANRAAMDEGGEPTWIGCYSPDDDEISAIQHAYNIIILDGRDVFDAECQQTPKRLGEKPGDLKAEHIIAKANGLPRGLVPLWGDRVTVFTDVQDNALYWLALATGKGFTAHVLDYGIFPDQMGGGLNYSTAHNTLLKRYPGAEFEGALTAGVRELVTRHSESVWEREEDHVKLSVALQAVDSSDNTALIYAAIRGCVGVANVVPSKGRGIGARVVQWVDFPDRVGEELNREYHWLLGPTRGSGTQRVLQYDTNWWKSFVMRRLRTAKGDTGCLTLFGEAYEHTQFAAHLLSERGNDVTTSGRTVEEWSLLPGQKDNHLLDCLVGAFVLAARAGCSLTGLESRAKDGPRKVNSVRR